MSVIGEGVFGTCLECRGGGESGEEVVVVELLGSDVGVDIGTLGG